MSSGQNGKGSKRRAAQVSEEQLEANWRAAFGPRKPLAAKEKKPTVGEVLLGDYTTPAQWVIPALEDLYTPNEIEEHRREVERRRDR